MNTTNHLTTRRAFIAASGFGGLGLYGLWAAYGAAPGPSALFGLDGAASHAEKAAASPMQVEAAGGHGGHGGASAGPTPEEFSRMTAEFSERFRLPDGSVYPRRLVEEPTLSDDPHAGHDMAAMDMPEGQAMPASHGTMAGAPVVDTHAEARHEPAQNVAASQMPIDVLMTAGKWYYLPNVLRLDVGQAYRFRMMALDVSHGASIQFGRGGRMMRLQPGRLTETELTFERAGRYLMYCTVYCGAAHDMMQATIEVV